ncbi:MAG: hypothetical protein II916_08950 [Oscillospiraceae bacterium]|nr:hypothetical protein [Oscillospiraceae bacterium]
MLVHYYEIRSCTCDNVDNRPVLVAPPETVLDLLTKYNFVLTADGRWVHFLTTPEYDHVMTGYPNRDVTFSYQPSAKEKPQETPEERKAGNRLATIGFLLLALSIVMPMAAVMMTEAADKMPFEEEGPLLSTFNTISYGIGSLSQIAAFVMMLVTRIKYPKNTLGKVLMWIYIVGAILAALAAILIIVACASCLNELSHCPG